MFHLKPQLSRIIRGRTLILFALALFQAVALLDAQTRNSFETESPTWQLAIAKSENIKKTFQQSRSSKFKKGGLRSEAFQFEAALPEKVLVGLDVEPVAAIPELNPQIWVRNPGNDLQIMARVVLPFSKIQGSDEPVSLLIEGPMVTPRGEWQKLGFAVKSRHIKKLVDERVWFLRERYKKSTIVARGAYIDMLLVGVYATRGQNKFWLDELSIDGEVSAKDLAVQVERNGALVKNNLIRASTYLEEEKPAAPFQRKGSVIEYRGQPYSIRCIEYNGESFQFLKSLGFNSIELKREPTSQQLAEATRLGIWLISPPPEQVGLYKLDHRFKPVMAWKIGSQLGGQDIARVQQTIREIAESEVYEGRPVIVDADSHFSTFGRLASAISISRMPIGSSMQLSQYDRWLQRWRKQTGNLPFVVSVQTELPSDLKRQVHAISGRVPPCPVSPQQMQYMLYEAITGGARGIRFQSSSRLDANDPSSRLRTATIRWLAQQLIELEPWLAGGAVSERINTGIQNLEVAQIKTSETRLLLVQKTTGNEQWFAGDATIGTQAFHDTQSVIGDQAHWLSDQGILSRSRTVAAGKLSIDLKNTGICSAFVVTQSPKVLNRISQLFEKMNAEQRNRLQTELTQNWLAVLQLLARQNAEVGGGSIAVQGPIDQAGVHFNQGESLVRRQSPLMAMPYYAQADRQLALARRELVSAARRGFRSRAASPLALHCSLVPSHWQLSRKLTTGKWNPNGLAGGDFENLKHMQDNGWENHRSDNDQVQTLVELAADAALQGNFGLKISAYPRSTNRDPLVESTPVWIQTGPVAVKSGQLVRIHGWVRIPQTITGSIDGLLITDTLGNDALAERIYATNDWQEFTLYRAVPENGELKIKFALTGFGSVMLDQVTVRTIDIPLSDREANSNANGRR